MDLSCRAQVSCLYPSGPRLGHAAPPRRPTGVRSVGEVCFQHSLVPEAGNGAGPPGAAFGVHLLSAPPFPPPLREASTAKYSGKVLPTQSGSSMVTATPPQAAREKAIAMR